MSRLTWLLGLLLLPTLAGAEPVAVFHGELGTDCETIFSGEYAARYTVDTAGGELFAVEMRADGFEPYLIVLLGDDAQIDEVGVNGVARVAFVAPAGAPISIVATSGQIGDAGGYELAVFENTLAGELGAGDVQLDSGEFTDTLPLWLPTDSAYTVTCSSPTFDPYLILQQLDTQVDVDDAVGLGNAAQAVVTAEDSHITLLQVTSAQPGGSGIYTLTFSPNVPSLLQPLRMVASLTADDPQLSDGERFDQVAFLAEAGASYRVRMTSTAVDTYLVVIDPAGDVFENDDFNHNTDADLTFTAGRTGVVQVYATSAMADELGTYELVVEPVSRPYRDSDDVQLASTHPAKQPV